MWDTMLSYIKKMIGYFDINFGPKYTQFDVPVPIKDPPISDKIEVIVPTESVPAVNVTGYGAVRGTGNSTYNTANDVDNDGDGGPIWF